MESLFIMFIFESIGQLSLVIGSIRNDIPNAHSVWYVSSKNRLEHFVNVVKTKQDSPTFPFWLTPNKCSHCP